MASHSPRLQHAALSSRRGSAAAPDPFALNAARETANASRTVTSTLTIVRVPSTSVEDQDPKTRRRRRSSGGSVGSNASGHRISFASGFGAGFTTIHAPTPVRPGHLAHGLHSRKSSSASIPSLPERPFTPAEIVDLAHEAAHPTTPGMADAGAQQFTELDDDVLLPFLDRPDEIAVLISIPPTSKLVTLVSQMLPAEDGTEADGPAKWSAAQFDNWLRTVTREEVPDALWIEQLRICVSSHSELLWERLKDALGVPGELPSPIDDSPLDMVLQDEDGDFIDIEPVFLDSAPASPVVGTIREDSASVSGVADAIQGLRILNAPSNPLGLSMEEGDPRPQPVKVHPHGSPRPHFPKTFSEEVIHPGPHGYAHFVAQRLLNNASPARR